MPKRTIRSDGTMDPPPKISQEALDFIMNFKLPKNFKKIRETTKKIGSTTIISGEARLTP